VRAQPAVKLGNDTILCAGDSITLGAGQTGVNYKWNMGDTACCINISTGGIYSETGYNDCGSSSDTISVAVSPCQKCLVVPSAFTPNHDGENDVFKAIPLCTLKEYEVKIYNRWGQLVYSSGDVTSSWDGTYNGVAQNIDVYYYFIKYLPDLPGATKEISLKGDVTIVR
jgi:gliding motility-associated-like protein